MKNIRDCIKTDDHSVDWVKFINDKLFGTDASKTLIFKGMLKGWHLESTLERICERWVKSKDNLQLIEGKIIRDYQRHAPEIHNINIDNSDLLSWLALMRHWGTPSRLIDWTYSPVIALFFALKYYVDKEEEKCPEIWEINTKLFDDEVKKINLSKKTRKYLNKYIEDRDNKAFKKIFINPRYSFVYSTNPMRFNQRLISQKGLFLMATDIRKTFEENFMNIPNWQKYIVINKINIGKDDLITAFSCLDKMNINNKILFQGLDGFSDSYNYNPRFFEEFA